MCRYMRKCMHVCLYVHVTVPVSQPSMHACARISGHACEQTHAHMHATLQVYLRFALRVDFKWSVMEAPNATTAPSALAFVTSSFVRKQ